MTLPERQLANAIRALAMDAVQAANSGHPGMPMGMADVATVLYSDYLKFDPTDPKWADRDRFVLSAGHGSMLAYATLHLAGYAHPTIDEIRNFRQLSSPCAGPPAGLPGEQAPEKFPLLVAQFVAGHRVLVTPRSLRRREKSRNA